MKFEIVGKTFESPVIEAENTGDAIIKFATNMDLDMNLYFKAIPADNANDLTEREEEPDEPELMFTCENEQRVFYDLANFLWEFADGNFFTSDKISNVEVYGKAQNLRLNITSMFELACILDAEDKYHFRGTASSYSCDPTGSHVMHDKSYYLDKFKDKIAKCTEEEKNNAHQEGVKFEPYFVEKRFDEECNAEEIVGFYIYDYGDDALKTWRDNIEGRVITDEIREVTRILEYLYTSEPYAISPQTALTVLAANMPKDFSEFNSETESGEPEHLMDLPNGRTLKIVYQDTGYSWQVLYSDEEFTELDFNSDDKVIAKEDVDGFDYDTVYGELDWAIRIASETPKYQPSFKVGDEVRYNGDFCYVIDIKDRGLNLFNTERRNSFSVSFEQVREITLEGHSEMAEKVFS